MGAPVIHWEINANDASRLQSFYSGLFGWKINANNPLNYGLVNTGSKNGIQGGIAQKDPTIPAPNVTFYMEVKDLQSYLTRAEELGGRTVLPPTEIPNMVTLAMFSDPEGNIVGLVKAVKVPVKKKRTAKPRKGTRRSSRKSGKKR
jgi:uncharacterized protein